MKLYSNSESGAKKQKNLKKKIIQIKNHPLIEFEIFFWSSFFFVLSISVPFFHYHFHSKHNPIIAVRTITLSKHKARFIVEKKMRKFFGI